MSFGIFVWLIFKEDDRLRIATARRVSVCGAGLCSQACVHEPETGEPLMEWQGPVGELSQPDLGTEERKGWEALSKDDIPVWF